MDSLPDRLGEDLFLRVSAIADAPLAEPERASDDYILRCLKTMQSVLPRQKTDSVSGELAVETYLRFFRGHPKEQVAYMAKQAVMSCEWFPTIHKCMEIMKGWVRHDEATIQRAKARRIVEAERVARLEDFFGKLASGAIRQEKIDELPDGIVWEARKRGILSWNGERFIVTRPAIS